VLHYTDLAIWGSNNNPWYLCYHLLFSFRICRAESEIPLG